MLEVESLLSSALINIKSPNGRNIILTIPGGRDLAGHPILFINIRGYGNNGNNSSSRINIVDILQYLLSIFRLVYILLSA